MSDPGSAVFFTGNEAEVMDWLRGHGVERVRVEFCDFAGVARGKAMPLAHFEHALDHGIAFCATIMSFDIAANVVPGTDFAERVGYADFVAKPDLSSLRLLRHEPRAAICMSELCWTDGRPFEACPRRVLHRVAARLEEMGYGALAAPEFEFNLLDESFAPLDEDYQCYSMQKRTQYLEFESALLDAVSAHGPLECSHYEYGPGQYEISIRYQDLLRMADNGHLFRATMKEAAMGIGKRVTFMAKPFDGKTGNSCHLHLSLVAKGRNAFAAPAKPLRINDTCLHFIGGVLARLPELTAIFFPNANSYRRLVPGNFAPITLAWGVDNRTAAVRVLNESPAATRAELRVCGGDVNVYLAFAAYLAAGLDGIARGTDPGPAAEGDLDEAEGVPRLPDDWGDALDAFDASTWARDVLGEEFCRNYSVVKRFEYEAFRRSVPDSERRRYVEWL